MASIFFTMLQASRVRMGELTEKHKKLSEELHIADKEVKRIKKEMGDVLNEIEKVMTGLEVAKESLKNIKE